MDAQTEGLPLIFQRAISAAPAHDAGEAIAVGRRLRRPVVEHDRRRCGDPLEATGWNQATGLADILADGDVVVMATKYLSQAQVVPHLAEARINIQEDAPGRGSKYLLIVEEAHDV